MNNLRKTRRAADKTQLQLMCETGIFFSTISRIERGWLRPTKEQRIKLARALKVDARHLFPDEDAQEGKNGHEIS